MAVIKKRKKIRRTYVKKRSFKGYLLMAILAFAVLGAAVWSFLELAAQKPANDWFEAKSISLEGGQLNLPKDDAPHLDAKTEWWSYHGRLTSESGKHYSFEYATILTFYLKGQAVSHVAFSDSQSGLHFTDQFNNDANPNIADENVFYFSNGERLMQGGGGSDHLKVTTKDFAFDLLLKAHSDPVFHGKKGAISMGSLGNSYYYSRARLTIAGSVSVAGKTETVRGVAWFDHQWGDFLTKKLAWDWFGLQLADGSDVMVYQIRDAANKAVFGNGSITRDGVTAVLSGKDFFLLPGSKWTSQKTGATFPVEWKLSIPNKNIDIAMRGIVKNNEFDARATTGNIYWQGALSVQGTHVGQGFMNLQGYPGKN